MNENMMTNLIVSMNGIEVPGDEPVEEIVRYELALERRIVNTYIGTVEIEARSLEEARAKVREMVAEGWEPDHFMEVYMDNVQVEREVYTLDGEEIDPSSPSEEEWAEAEEMGLSGAGFVLRMSDDE